MTKRIDTTPPGELRDRNTIAQVAAFWGVSTDTVRRLAESGKLNALRIGGVIRITREHVEVYEAENCTALQAKKEKEGAEAFRQKVRDPFEMGRKIATTARSKATPDKV